MPSETTAHWQELLPPATDAPRHVVVVGFDGSAPSRRALAWAARRTTPGGRIILVTATHPAPGTLGRPGLDLVAHDPLEHARLALDESTLDAAPPDIEVVVVDDTPAHALAKLASEREAQEIAVGGAPGRVDGDVAAELLLLTDRPVVVIR